MAAKTMAEMEKDAKVVKVYAPLEEMEIDLPAKRVAQLKRKYGTGYKHKFKITVKEFKHKNINDKDTRTGAWSSKGDVVLKRKNTREYDVAHEEGHVVYGHVNYNTENPVAWAKEEMDAELYAYKKTGDIHDEKGFIRGIFWTMTHGTEDTKHTRTTGHYDAVKGMDKIMSNPEMPDKWRKDWEAIKDEERGY
jgi:hypothetical protein